MAEPATPIAVILVDQEGPHFGVWLEIASVGHGSVEELKHSTQRDRTLCTIVEIAIGRAHVWAHEKKIPEYKLAHVLKFADADQWAFLHGLVIVGMAKKKVF